MENKNYKISFNIDRGGTFTDIYCEWFTDKKECVVYKLLSQDPQNYEDAPSEGIRRLLNKITGSNINKGETIPTDNIESIRMGTTLATNALLERKGERCALLITEGFSDLLEIGNQTRSNIFDLKILKPEKIYESVYEVKERVRILKDKSEVLSDNVAQGSTGEYVEILKPLDEEQIKKFLVDVKSKGIKSLAVAFTHSYTFRDHELRVKEIAKEYGFENISISHEIMPMVKFYPRGSTAVVDAYLTPAIYSYVQRFMSFFDNNIHSKNVLFMQSDGGLTNHETFFGSKAIISGPAAGVVGYSITTAREVEGYPIIGLDMGGTSTDVSRYDNGWDHVFEVQISGIAINAPQIDVNTVAAGGGSRLFFKNGMFVVGPESAGAEPGPMCYKKNGYLAVTDANLLLGRLIPEYFPKIFGKGANEPLSVDDAMQGMKEIAEVINKNNNTSWGIEEVAMGFIKVANEAMCRPILSLTQARGYDPKDHVLSIFGGAGGQHACAIAKILNIKKVYIHKYAGILSAYGLSKAEIVEEMQEPVNRTYNDDSIKYCNDLFAVIEQNAKEKLNKFVNQNYSIKTTRYLLMKYTGTDYNLVVQESNSYKSDFEKSFKREYGFLLENRELVIDYARVRLALVPINEQEFIIADNEKVFKEASSDLKHSTYFDVNDKITKLDTDVYFWEKLESNTKINGPALILSGNSTIIIEPDCHGIITSLGNLILNIPQTFAKENNNTKIEKDPLELSLFANRFMGIAEQMGRHLQRTSVSVNIKERLDFSCAIFDDEGNLVANAPHLPVHLGAMQEVVKHQKNYLKENWKKGEVILCNHPQAGGSHLPDLTVITPVYFNDRLVFYVGNRGHHSDIGGLTSGSMPPFSKKLDDEGAAIYSFKLVENESFQEESVVKIFRDDLIKKGVHPSRNLSDNISDLKAQVAANHKGVDLLNELIGKFGLEKILAYMKFIQDAAEDSVRDMLDKFAEKIGIKENEKGIVYSDDYMDDGSKICLSIAIDRKDKSAIFDFNGTSPQVYGNINTPKSVTFSAIIYCLRCLVNTDIPLNQGCLNPIQVVIPKNSLLWPSESCAVVGGNVTTSQRITDIILKAFKACAAAQGDMNNFTFGNENFGYYETIGGGSGAGPTWNGTSGVQVHMTNTRITDVEIIERRFPLIIQRFSYRKGSGGRGKYHGGDGIIRTFKFYEPLVANILSERRVHEPFGLEGGCNGQRGLNLLITTDGQTYNIGGRNTLSVGIGDCITIMTPGGGGFGKPDGEEHETEKDKTIYPKENTGSLANLIRDQYTN
jgi:5-oxoprolinase (ATP-hydrolysing)